MSGARPGWTTARALAEEADRVRGTIESKRSDSLLRLFDFLLERSIEGNPPKESEIADAIFPNTFDPSHAAKVRVYIHRLRKKLDQYYAQHPDGPRLLIPLSDYRLILSDREAGSLVRDDQSEAGPRGPAMSRKLKIIALMAGLAMVNAAFAFHALALRKPAQDPVASSDFWNPLAQSKRARLVAIGDYYLFAEMQDDKTIGRMVRDPSISSPEDLDIYLMRNSQALGKMVNSDFRTFPAGAVTALKEIWPIMRSLSPTHPRPAALIPASQVNTDTLKSSNIVYVGPLDGLGALLRNPLFQASGFRVGNTYNELIDAESGRHFIADSTVLTDDKTPRKDYGYIASLPGPAGNHILYISGLRDPAVLQMAELVNDPAMLKTLHQRVGGEDEAFEALFQVRTLGSVNLDSTLLIARPLRSRAIWDHPQASQRFPGDIDMGADKQQD
jgi:hypothetical protein